MPKLKPIAQHEWRHVVEEFARLAALSMENGSLDDAMLLGYLGGAVASSRMTGYYSLPGLERPFLQYAGSRPVAGVDNQGRGVLHIMTAAYPIGGHTPLVAQVIQNGFLEQRNSVLLTNQKVEAAPGALRRAVEKTGGTLHSLVDGESFVQKLSTKLRFIWPHRKYQRRARRQLFWSSDAIAKKTAFIRTLGVEHERVILSTHMDDPWPILGFGHPDFPRPVFVMNHADHLFWMGRSVTDAVLEFRPYGKDISDRKRGAPGSLMIPFHFEKTKPTEAEERGEIRRRLGLPGGKLVIASVGSSYKYAPRGEWNYPRFILDTLADLPEIIHLVIGPSREDANWKDAAAEAGDRLVMPGIVPHEQLEPWLRASDLYVGGFPLGGGFVLHDAARIGLPALLTKTPAYYAGAKSEHDWVYSSVSDLREGLRRYVHAPDQLERLRREQGDYFEQCHGSAAYRSAVGRVAGWEDRHRVYSHWSVDSTVEAIDNHFNAVLSKSYLPDEKLQGVISGRLRELHAGDVRRTALRVIEN